MVGVWCCEGHLREGVPFTCTYSIQLYIFDTLCTPEYTVSISASTCAHIPLSLICKCSPRSKYFQISSITAAAFTAVVSSEATLTLYYYKPFTLQHFLSSHEISKSAPAYPSIYPSSSAGLQAANKTWPNTSMAQERRLLVCVPCIHNIDVFTI